MSGNNGGNQFDILDIISIASFFVGLDNLYENRAQSAHNDITAANDKQAKQILSEIDKRLDRQDAMLKEILEVINRETD